MWFGIGKGKGGAGCTTSVLELAYAATRRHTASGRPRRVAVLDLDPQGDATSVLEPEDLNHGIKDVLAPHDPLPLAQALVPTAWENVLLAPASRYLANRELDMTPQALTALRRARLDGDLENLVDDVVIDIPRHVGKLSTAGLLAMEHLFIAARASLWGAQGAEEMRYTAQRIARKGNPELRIAGVIVTEYDNSRDAERVLGNMKEEFGSLLLSSQVPRDPQVREALESYHTPCRDFGAAGLVGVADVYQGIYDRLSGRGKS